jgi:PTS system mannose-specific IIA component
MFGGTATNLALPYLEPEKVEIVTGVNLPMLVKLGSLQGRSMSLDELATGLTAAGQKSIRVASEFLHARASGAG